MMWTGDYLFNARSQWTYIHRGGDGADPQLHSHDGDDVQ